MHLQYLYLNNNLFKFNKYNANIIKYYIYLELYYINNYPSFLLLCYLSYLN